VTAAGSGAVVIATAMIRAVVVVIGVAWARVVVSVVLNIIVVIGIAGARVVLAGVAGARVVLALLVVFGRRTWRRAAGLVFALVILEGALGGG